MTLSKFMKNKYISAAATLVVAAATLVLTGCSNDIDNYTEDNNPTDNIVRFDIGVQDDMGTRAIITNDNLQSSVKESNPIYFQNNVRQGPVIYNNGWVGDDLVWKNLDKPTDVIATYGAVRYNKNGDQTFSLEKSITNQSADVADFLFFMRKDFVPSRDLVDGKLRIDFTHKLSLVDIVVNYGSTQAGNPVSNVRLGGTITNVKAQPTTFDNGIPRLEAAGSSEQIIPHEESVSQTSAKYECSVIPQTVSAGNLFVSFTLNGKDYIWSSTKDLTFSEGKRNTITITVQ